MTLVASFLWYTVFLICLIPCYCNLILAQLASIRVPRPTNLFFLTLWKKYLMGYDKLVLRLGKKKRTKWAVRVGFGYHSFRLVLKSNLTNKYSSFSRRKNFLSRMKSIFLLLGKFPIYLLTYLNPHWVILRELLSAFTFISTLTRSAHPRRQSQITTGINHHIGCQSLDIPI